MKMLWSFGWPLIAVFGAYAVYATIVKPKLAEASQILGKAQKLTVLGGLPWILAKVNGWKTPILAVVAGAAQMAQLIDADMLHEWQQLPWGSIFDARTANEISVACAFLIPITHSLGILSSAKTTPQPPQV